MAPRKRPHYTASERKEKVLQVAESIMNLKGCVAGCKEAGVPYQTYLDWIRKYPELSLIIKNASEVFENKGEEYAVKSVFSHMDKQWQAGAWWLERRFPDRYALQNRHDVSGGCELRVKLEYVKPKGFENHAEESNGQE